MNEIVLSGCTEANFPIGAMAAFGVLRMLTQLPDDEGKRGADAGHLPRLSWQVKQGWTPALHTHLTPDDVVRSLTDAAKRATTARAWTTAPDLRKVSPNVYRELLQACDCAGGEELSAAFACEWPLAKDGKLMLTPFFMTSGQQQWFRSICKAAQLSGRPGGSGANAIEEALFGPWRYVHELSALGWDPATERQHALEAEAPTKSGSPRAVSAAVWLAAESLALFPCFTVGRKLRATCFDEERRTFFWPVWQSPLTYDAVRAMLRLPLAGVRQSADQSMATRARQELGRRGIDAVFASQRMASAAGHGYYVFSPAELLWSR